MQLKAVPVAVPVAKGHVNSSRSLAFVSWKHTSIDIVCVLPLQISFALTWTTSLSAPRFSVS